MPIGSAEPPPPRQRQAQCPRVGRHLALARDPADRRRARARAGSQDVPARGPPRRLPGHPAGARVRGRAPAPGSSPTGALAVTAAVLQAYGAPRALLGGDPRRRRQPARGSWRSTLPKRRAGSEPDPATAPRAPARVRAPDRGPTRRRAGRVPGEALPLSRRLRLRGSRRAHERNRVGDAAHVHRAERLERRRRAPRRPRRRSPPSRAPRPAPARSMMRDARFTSRPTMSSPRARGQPQCIPMRTHIGRSPSDSSSKARCSASVVTIAAPRVVEPQHQPVAELLHDRAPTRAGRRARAPPGVRASSARDRRRARR